MSYWSSIIAIDFRNAISMNCRTYLQITRCHWRFFSCRLNCTSDRRAKIQMPAKLNDERNMWQNSHARANAYKRSLTRFCFFVTRQLIRIKHQNYSESNIEWARINMAHVCAAQQCFRYSFDFIIWSDCDWCVPSQRCIIMCWNQQTNKKRNAAVTFFSFLFLSRQTTMRCIALCSEPVFI